MEATHPTRSSAAAHLTQPPIDRAPASNGSPFRSACRSFALTCGDVVGAAAAAAAVGLALIAAGRVAAWIGMLVLTIGIALLAGRAAGTTAAATSALLYLSAHGQPRFATTTTDPTTIRLGLLLGLVGAVGTFWVTVRHPRQVLQTGDSTTTRSRQEGQRP